MSATNSSSIVDFARPQDQRERHHSHDNVSILTTKDAHLPSEEQQQKGKQTQQDNEKQNQESPGVAGGSRTRQITGVKWFLVVAAILVNTFVYAIDNTIVAVIQPAIVERFGRIPDLPWLSVGFIMAGTATALPISGLFGALDTKWLYIAFTGVFAVGSALCGAAPNMDALIIGRVIAGVGGNGMYIGALTLLSVFSKPQETPAYIGYIGLSWGLGTVIGPIIGGAFVDSPAGWRWGFYINLVIGAVSLPILLILTPSFQPRQEGISRTAAIRNVDLLGSALSVAALVTGIMAISFGGTTYAWQSPQTVSLFWTSGVLFLAFWLQQRLRLWTSLAARLFPIHFFLRRDLILIFVIQASVASVVVVPLYYLALYFGFAQGDSAIRAGVKLLPLVATLVTMIVLNGHMMSLWGYHQVWILGGSVLITVSGAILSRINAQTSNGVIWGLEVVLGIGTGAFSQAGYAIAQAMVDPGEIQSAISFMLIAQLGGTTLGLSIAGAIFQNRSFSTIAGMLPDLSAAAITEIISGVNPSLLAGLSESMQQRILEVIVQALTDTFVLIYVAGALCLLCGALLKRRPHLLGRTTSIKGPRISSQFETLHKELETLRGELENMRKTAAESQRHLVSGRDPESEIDLSRRTLSIDRDSEDHEIEHR